MKIAIFRNGDCDDWKRNSKSFGRRRQKGAIDIARTDSGEIQSVQAVSTLKFVILRAPGEPLALPFFPCRGGTKS